MCFTVLNHHYQYIDFCQPDKSWRRWDIEFGCASRGNDCHQNSMSSSNSDISDVPSDSLEEYDPLNPQRVEVPRRRNDALRESARKIYSNPETQQHG